MSKTYSNLKNKHQRHPKVHFQQYLYTADDPYQYISNSPPAELEAELLENIESVRQRFRLLARRIRSR